MGTVASSKLISKETKREEGLPDSPPPTSSLGAMDHLSLAEILLGLSYGPVDVLLPVKGGMVQ